MENKFTSKDNIIDSWLQENGDPEITKQVEREAEELMENYQELEEAKKQYEEETRNFYSEEDMRSAYNFGMFAVTTGRNFSDWIKTYKKK